MNNTCQSMRHVCGSRSRSLNTGLELKEVRFRGLRVVGPRRNDLADELAGCANGPGGRLVLGVTDERRLQAAYELARERWRRAT